MNKNRKYGLSSTIFSIILIAIIIVVNLGIDKLAEKYPLKADLTENGIYKLSDYTKNMLKELDKDVTVYAFYYPTAKNESILEILYRYQRESSHIKLSVVSPGENPALSLKYDESNTGLNSGTVIFDCDGKFTTVTEDDMSNYSSYLGYETEIYVEEKFTESIIYVTSDIRKKIYTVMGHGESDGYDMRNVLNQYSYERAELTLGDEGVPSDASLLMIIAPIRDYTEKEIAVLDGYLKSGGKLFVALEPSAQNLDKLYGYLSEWGIETTDEFVIEGSAGKTAFNNRLMFYATGKSHPINGSIFDNKYTVLVANTKPVYINETKGVVNREVITTSESGYVVSAENFETAEQILKGYVPVAATAEKDETKIAVFGSHLYFMDTIFMTPELANKEMFLNALDWLNGDKVNTGIRPKNVQGTMLTISESQSSMIIGIVIALPIIIVLFGVYVFIRRRHK